MSSTVIDVERRHVTLPNPDKVLFPADGITKADLAAYYQHVAQLMLPHLRRRPLVLERYPDGIDGDSFRRTCRNFPDWVPRATMDRRGGGTVTHVVADDDPMPYGGDGPHQSGQAGVEVDVGPVKPKIDSPSIARCGDKDPGGRKAVFAVACPVQECLSLCSGQQPPLRACLGWTGRSTQLGDIPGDQAELDRVVRR